MIRQILVIFAMLLLATTTVQAGKIYGSLQVDGTANIIGKDIKINCSNEKYDGKVQEYGRYIINVSSVGRCTFTISYNNEDVTTDIVSFKEATRYNFMISFIKNKNKYELIRK